MDFDDIQKGSQQRPRRPQPVSSVQLPPTPRVPEKLAVEKKESKKATLAQIYRKHKKVAYITIAAILLTSIGIAAAALSGGNSSQKPSYKTVLPAGESISQLGGWKIVSPPESDPVYAYSDTIDGTSITVSQQPAPKDSNGKTEPIELIAEKFFATQKIEGTDAYIGTSSRGPQSALFIRKGTLIMIKSQQNISNKSWATYINNLR